jgi:hypothetical protein
MNQFKQTHALRCFGGTRPQQKRRTQAEQTTLHAYVRLEHFYRAGMYPELSVHTRGRNENAAGIGQMRCGVISKAFS